MTSTPRIQALLVTAITSVLEIADMIFSGDWSYYSGDVEIFLAAITPLAVWLVPRWKS